MYQLSGDIRSTIVAQEVIGEGELSLAGDYLVAVRDFALRHGINTQTLLAGSKIPLSALLNPPQRVGDFSMHTVGLNLIDALDNPHSAAIEFGRSMAITYHGVLGVAAQSAGNLLEACRMLTQFMMTRSSVTDIEIIEQADTVKLSIVQKSSLEYVPNKEVRLFFDVATLVNLDVIGRQLLSNYEVTEKTILCLDIEQPDNFPFEMLGDTCDVSFGHDRNELCVPLEWMHKPLSFANPELAMVAADRCESELRQLSPKDLVGEVRQRIRDAQESKPTLDQVASQLFMSASTLKRRLKEQQTTYQKLKDDERLKQAEELLTGSSISLEDISEKLGFSDASNFTKAFKNWTGITPKVFRQQQK